MLRESTSQVSLSMVRLSVVWMPLAASNVGALAATVTHSEATEMLIHLQLAATMQEAPPQRGHVAPTATTVLSVSS